jgi:uncharacterized protein (DUF2249 family)
MTTASQTLGYELHRTPAAMPGDLPLTLTDEHTLLLSQVVIRAEDLLAVTDEGRWPARELRALLGYLRAEVLRQAADEETLLFPADASPGISRLALDHARLRDAIETLERMAADVSTRSPAQLAAATRDLLHQLERHFHAGEALLATAGAPGKVPATTMLGGHPHEWYPLTEGPVIELDMLPAAQAVGAAVHRLLRLRRGEQVELHAGTDPHLVWRQLNGLCPGVYRFVYLQNGPDRWRVQVTRRPAA